MIFSFVFKDLISTVINMLIYIGMVSSFFGMKGKSKNKKKIYSGVADGVIDIIIMVLNIGLVFIFIFKFNNYLIENKYIS